MSTKLQWGILGTGNIAGQFAEALGGAHRGEAAAVASRKTESARAFAKAHNIARAYGHYDELLTDPAVDAVYLALPNSMHHEWVLKALRAGKHVLNEKPFARDAAESEEMFDVAEQQGRMLVEAFMYRCHPQTKAVMAAVARGEIGQLNLIRTSFCFCVRKTEGNVRFSRPLAGGALMDIGCYCVNFTRTFAGREPTAVQAAARMHETGIDDITVATMSFDHGVIGSFTCGVAVHIDNTAYLGGTEGFIEVPWPWKPPADGSVFHIRRSIPPRQDKPKSLAPPPVETVEVPPADRPLYAVEADAFAETVLDGAPPVVDRADTLGNMNVLDDMRRQIGLAF